MEDPGIAVYDAELYYSEKYEEWLELRKKQFRFYPNDESTRFRYAEALYQTGKLDEALGFLKKFHKDDPEDEDFNQLILEILRKQGLNKSDFDWEFTPETLSLNGDLEKMILFKMKAKRKRKESLNKIFLDVIVGNLVEFDETGLMKYLKKRKAFVVTGDKYYDAVVERIG